MYLPLKQYTNSIYEGKISPVSLMYGISHSNPLSGSRPIGLCFTAHVGKQMVSLLSLSSFTMLIFFTIISKITIV